MIKITNIAYIKNIKDFHEFYGLVNEKQFWIKQPNFTNSGYYAVLTLDKELDKLYDTSDGGNGRIINELYELPAYFGVIEPDDNFDC